MTDEPICFSSGEALSVEKIIKVPVTMCHGISSELTLERFREYLNISAQLGFNSINYDQLYTWLQRGDSLPKNPIMFDFDHPVLNIYSEIYPMMKEFNFTGNLFINSGYYEAVSKFLSPKDAALHCATWDQVGELMEAGWTIGAHTHTHPDLSDLAEVDYSGEIIAGEMDKNNALLKSHLGLDAKYFAFTGGNTGLTWSSSAEIEAKKRYRLGRLWIVDAPVKADGKLVRYSDFVGVPGPDEVDGGPPYAARYITKNTPFFKIPSMELERALIFEPDAFRDYLAMAL